MKKLIIIFCGLCLANALQAQMVATVEEKEPIAGTCDTKHIYAIIPGFKHQVEAVCPVSKKHLADSLKSKVQYLKDNPKFKGTMMMNCIVNCKGEMVKCEVDNKSGNDSLDAQVLAVFKTLLKWTPATLNDNNVDSVVLTSIEFKKGTIKID